jgi:hypothetical protein
MQRTSRILRQRKGARQRRRHPTRSRRQFVDSALVADVKMPPPRQISPMQTFTVQLRGYCGAASNGSGVLAGALPFDPSATLSSTFGSAAIFNEWTNFSNLFQNVKMLQFEAEFVRVQTDDTKGDIPEPLVIASSTSPTLVVPSTFQQVADNGDAQIWPVIQDYSGRARYHATRITQLAWALTSTPNPGSSSGISAGCPGSIIIFGTGYPVSVQVCSIKYTGTYLLRTRV